MLRPAHVYSLYGALLLSIASHAQYKGDDVPGFLGLQCGTQVPPQLCIGNVVWIYPTDTIKDANGNTVGQQRAHVASTADLILVELVTNYKLLGAEVGFQAPIPFIKNRIQLNLTQTLTSRSPICLSSRVSSAGTASEPISMPATTSTFPREGSPPAAKGYARPWHLWT